MHSFLSTKCMCLCSGRTERRTQNVTDKRFLRILRGDLCKEYSSVYSAISFEIDFIMRYILLMKQV